MNEQQFKAFLKTVGFKITEVPHRIDVETFQDVDSWFALCPDGFLRHRKSLKEAWGIV